MRKPTVCICENKGTDELCSNCEADRCLCFRYKDSTIPLLCFRYKDSTIPLLSNSLHVPASSLLCLYSLVYIRVTSPYESYPKFAPYMHYSKIGESGILIFNIVSICNHRINEVIISDNQNA